MKKLMISFCLLFAIGSLAAVPVDSTFCVGKPAGFYPHKDDCRVFYTCALNVTTVHSCPPGVVFDPENSQCDWPTNVKPPCGTKKD